MKNYRNYGECPECGTQCFLDAIGDEPHLVRIENRHPTSTDYGPGEDWTEIWKCPNCKHEFKERNGYP